MGIRAMGKRVMGRRVMRATRPFVPACLLAAADCIRRATHNQRAHSPARTVTMYIGFGPGGGYDMWARVVAAHLGKHLPGNPTVTPRKYAGRRQLSRRRLHLQYRAQGRHRDCRDRARCGARAADRRSRRAIRRHQAFLSRHPGNRNQYLHRQQYRGGEDRAGSDREGIDRRRYRARHRHILLPGGAQRHPRHEIQAGRRLSVLRRRLPRHGARRGAGHLRKPRQRHWSAARTGFPAARSRCCFRAASSPIRRSKTCRSSSISHTSRKTSRPSSFSMPAKASAGRS